tara:strand:+ start:227 stop:385 length:159 start_codon:yes stop_codon:yes gene_type:complete
MENIEKINPINEKDRKLLSDLSGTYDLGTKCIIDHEEDEETLVVNDLKNLVS